MNRENSRKYRRLDVDLPVQVTSADGKQLRRAENLSFGGMQIERGDGSLDKGSFMEVEFSIPECPVSVRCQAQVVHRTHDSLGISFRQARLFELAAIARHVKDRVFD